MTIWKCTSASRPAARQRSEWVNVQRLYDEDEEPDATAVVNGTSERQMRNQFNAWARYMTRSMTPPAGAESQGA